MLKNQATIMEEPEFIIIGEMTHEDHLHLRKLLIMIIILIISLTILQINKTQSYESYERVQFESSGAKLYANMYYPSNSIEFQEKRPLIIYTHGIGSKRDFDLRIPIEFTKRGYYVAALDYQGHGESGGNINKIDPITGIPALAQDCSKLLDKLETMTFFSDVNTTQIGLIGHSLGGMVALMNQALDPRFKVTVGLAPLVNFIPPRYGFVYNENLVKYIPINLLNNENTQNLLIIHHIDDKALDYKENALKARELTNCTVILMDGFLIGGGHQLYSDNVLINSINWFEQHFFCFLNGPIFITFFWNYILLFINIALIFTIAIYLISISSRLLFRNDRTLEESKAMNFQSYLNKSERRRQFVKLTVYIGVFLLNWLFFEMIFGILGIIYSSMCFSFIYLLIKSGIYFKSTKRGNLRHDVVEKIKSQIKLKYLIFTTLSVLFLIMLYMMISFYYPFGFVWPSNFILHFQLGYFALPIFLSIEILLRKIIYPELKFLKSEESKTKITLVISVILLISLMTLTRKLSYFPSFIFMYLIFLLVIIKNTKIFQHIRNFYPVVLISFTIIQIFFAAVLSNAIGVSTTI